MYHSTTRLFDGGETWHVQGSLAVPPFNTSTLGDTVTVTVPLQTDETHTYTDKYEKCVRFTSGLHHSTSENKE